MLIEPLTFGTTSAVLVMAMMVVVCSLVIFMCMHPGDCPMFLERQKRRLSRTGAASNGDEESQTNSVVANEPTERTSIKEDLENTENINKATTERKHNSVTEYMKGVMSALSTASETEEGPQHFDGTSGPVCPLGSTTRVEDEHDLVCLCQPGKDHSLGKLQFGVWYDQTMHHLSVKIFQAKDLPTMDISGSSDPYVKIVILPEKSNKVVTQVKDRKLNPKWNEIFVFEDFPREHLLNRSLLMTILDYDRFSRDDHIGEIHFPLICLHDDRFSFSEKTNPQPEIVLWKFLRPTKHSKGCAGELQLSLSYNPQNSRLKATVIKARDLSRAATCYCQLKLYNPSEKKSMQKQKTRVHNRDRYPIWNEGFVFEVPPTKLTEITLDVTIKEKEMIGADVIGRLRLGSRASAQQSHHWSEMLAHPRQPIELWHTLKY